MSEKLIEVKQAHKEFKKGKQIVNALNGIDLTIYQGETLGLVGESGSGKTTLGRSILTLETLTSGEIIYKNQVLNHLSTQEKQALLKEVQIIFQDPYSALNPRLSALEIVMEPLYDLPKEEARKRAEAILEKVGIVNEAIHKQPKDFSGGQRQRIGIARAVVSNPSFILCDEPTSALDVSIQAQILQLLVQLQKDYGLTYLFISHNLSVVRYIADRIVVMYQGVIVEMAPTEELFANPHHVYTKKLLSSVLAIDPKLARKQLTIFKDITETFTLDNTQLVEVAPDHFVRVPTNN